ncbi:hypothetical protein PG996_008840 [Apiospora saccharicola]|uniref:Uncharacterized protein n=1 Tax=Apiospora saccharicola TaxID=335842 RepID=A0ABR1V2F3_9PEZI
MASFAVMATADIWSIGLMIAVTLRISGLPRVWHCRKGNRHLQELAAHEKYAPSRPSRRSTPRAPPVFKGDEFYGLLDGGPEGGRSVQMERAPDAHAARRRVLDRAMPARDEAFRTINGLAGVFTDVIREQEGSTDTDRGKRVLEVDINQVASWYGFDLITALAFGQSLDLLRSDEYRWLPRCLQDASVFLYWAGFFRYALDLWRRFLGSKWPARLGMHTAVEAQRYADLADSQVYRRLDRLAREDEEKVTGITDAAAGTTDDSKDDEVGTRKKAIKRNDIFGHLLRANLYSRIDLRADSSLLIAAGSDAVRFTITATLFHWTTQSPPTSLARATAEVRTTSGLTPSTLTDAAVLGSPLRYLRACVDEAMRLNPPKPSSIPREVAPSSGMVIDGVVAPRAPPWPDPHFFRPERWLARPLDTRMVAAFCPFLKGPRACPGKTVAYLAVQLALFHLLYAFDVEAADEEAAEGSGGKVQGGRNDFAFNDWVIGYAQGLNIRFKPRM